MRQEAVCAGMLIHSNAHHLRLINDNCAAFQRLQYSNTSNSRTDEFIEPFCDSTVPKRVPQDVPSVVGVV